MFETLKKKLWKDQGAWLVILVLSLILCVSVVTGLVMTYVTHVHDSSALQKQKK
jgi:hypothetical protein